MDGRTDRRTDEWTSIISWDLCRSKNLLDECQFGFRRKRSTESATTIFTDNIKRKVNEGKMVGTVFIDLKKAFDTLSHAKILSKLKTYGISGLELLWFTD